MYYVIPAKAANAALAKKFIDFAESPEVQADGIVKQFNWYPGIDPQYVQAKLTPAELEQALHRHLAGRAREERPPVPAVGLLHRHRRRLRARRAEVTRRALRATRTRSSRVASGRRALRRWLARRGRGGWRPPMTPRWPPSAAGAPTLLVAPALAVIAAFFVFPLVLSAVLAFRSKDGGFTLEHFAKAWDLYRTDLMFTIGIVPPVDGR